MADVPGLIPGASTGKGLGVQFLRHVERCAVLVHVVDMATMEPGRDPESDIEALEHELAEYGGEELDLVGRLRIAVLNKIDVPDARELVDLVRATWRSAASTSTRQRATGEGFTEFGFALAAAVEAHRASLPPMEPARVTIVPKAVDDSGFTVERDPRTRGLRRARRPARALGAADRLHQRRGVGFLADRLNRLGVEEQLAKAVPARATRSPSAGSPSTGCRPCRPARSPSRSPRAWRPRHRQPHRRAAPGARRGAARRQEGPPDALRAQRRDLDGRRPAGRRHVTARPEIAGARRVVVKVGSSSLATVPGGLDAARLSALVDVLAAVRAAGREVVLVSSGAIAAGLAPLGVTGRPRDLATAQAAASVGQLRLVQTYADAFARHAITVGQVLLTADDLTRRSHYRNAHQTVERLLALGALPIVNENDTVATEEIRFGDNDRLAALVAHVARAEALVLLSDVDGVYDGDPRTGPAQLIDTVHGEADLASVTLGTASRNGVGTGGMATKVEAAFIAAHAGVPVVVTSSAQAAAALAGERVGTLFAPLGRRPSARQFWLRYASRPRGRLLLDDGGRAARPGAVRVAARGRASPAWPVTSWPTTRSSWSARTASSWPAGWSPTTPGRCRRCSAARPATCPRSTAARWCTATRWCWSDADRGLRDCSRDDPSHPRGRRPGAAHPRRRGAAFDRDSPR
jgi:glutamate 5-kinase